MTWVNQTLSDFGHQIGLEKLGLGTNGVVQLVLQDGGLLAVEPVRRNDIDEVLIYCGRLIGFDSVLKIRNALSCIHYLQNTRYPLQIATLGAAPDLMLIALVRLPERDFTLPMLSTIFDYLCVWFDQF